MAQLSTLFLITWVFPLRVVNVLLKPYLGLAGSELSTETISGSDYSVARLSLIHISYFTVHCVSF